MGCPVIEIQSIEADAAIWEVWLKGETGFDRYGSVKAADKLAIEKTFVTMTCGGALIIL